MDNIPLEFQKDFILHLLDQPPEDIKEYLFSDENIEIFKIIPFLKESKNCVEMSKWHKEKNVFEHLVNTLYSMSLKTKDPYLRLAAFLHDAGKPFVANNNKFYNHEGIGAKIVKKWMLLLKFPSEEVNRVETLIKHHMFYFDTINETNIRKWVQYLDLETFNNLILLRICDREGNLSKINKNLITPEMKKIIKIVGSLAEKNKIIFRKDIKVSNTELKKIGYKTKQLQKIILGDIYGILYNDKTKNKNKFLVNYAEKRLAKIKRTKNKYFFNGVIE